MITGDLVIREAEPADATPMALVIERANAERDGLPLPRTAEDAEIQTDLEEKMAKADAWTYVATLGGQVVGLVVGFPSSEAGYSVEDPEAEYLSLLMVDPSNWGQRIASLLIDVATYHTRQQGKHTLFLWTREDDNERARTFYEHKGFRATDERRISERRGPQVQYSVDL